MQATAHTTWFGIDRMKLTLVAAGVLASTMVGAAVTLTGALPGSGSENTPALSVTADTQLRSLTMERAEFTDWQASQFVAGTGTEDLEANGLPVYMEQNLDLPTSDTASVANLDADYRFMEQNLDLPGSSIPVTDSTMDSRFFEQNLDLPQTPTDRGPRWR